MMNRNGIRVAALGAALVCMLLTSAQAEAGGTIKIDDRHSVSIGVGLRTSINSVEDAAPSGEDRSKDFQLDSVRLYVNGQLHKNIFFEYNTERDAAGNAHVLDALVKLEFNDLFNIWAGRMLPPSDRSNLDGPYYLNAWDFPFVQEYPAIFAGRDDGAALWGQIGGGKFKYQVGAFEGTGEVDPGPDGILGTGDDLVGPNGDDNLLYAGRLVLNLWQPEPGYYNSSAYYGAKDVLAIGAAGMAQHNALGAAAIPGDFMGWNLDALLEKKLGAAGVVNLEGAYYDYDRDNVSPDSKGYFVLGSFLLGNKTGIGKLQPAVRYQSLDTDGVGIHKRLDLGLNYIIDGHNARVSLLYGIDDPAAGDASNLVRIGLQLQI